MQHAADSALASVRLASVARRQLLRAHQDLAAHVDVTARGLELARDQADERGLPGAVRADDAGDAGGEMKRDVVEHVDGVRVREGNAFDTDLCHDRPPLRC